MTNHCFCSSFHQGWLVNQPSRLRPFAHSCAAASVANGVSYTFICRALSIGGGNARQLPGWKSISACSNFQNDCVHFGMLFEFRPAAGFQDFADSAFSSLCHRRALSVWRFASRCASHVSNIVEVYSEVNRIPCNSESFFKINSPPHDGLESVAVRAAAILRLEFGVALRRSARAELSAGRAQPVSRNLMPRRRLACSAVTLLRVSWRL